MQAIKRKRRGPRAVDFTDPDWPRSGITIEYVKSKDMFYVSGWYDTYVGIEGTAISREELFSMLGVPERRLSEPRSPQKED